VERYARAGLILDAAQRHWAELLHRRQTSKDHPPTAAQLERAARRAGVADRTFKEATARLEALAACNGRGLDLASALKATQPTA
jgi:hypothetical protein